MISARSQTKLLLTALVAAVCAEYFLMNGRLSRILGPETPIQADIEDEIVFRNLTSGDGPPIVALIERSTRSDFTGMLADLESATVASVSYGVSQQNVPIRFSTAIKNRAGKPECKTFFEVSLAEGAAADGVSIRGKTVDGGDRAGNSGVVEFELLPSNTAAKLAITLDPGETGDPADCSGEFWVGSTRYPVGGLNPVSFHLNPGKRSTFRFSKPPGADTRVRLTSRFEASDVIIRRPDGRVRSQYSAHPGGQPISIREVVLGPAAIECSALGNTLWSEPGSRHSIEWAAEHPWKVTLYGVVDSVLIALLLRQARKARIVVWPVTKVVPTTASGSYVFLSYDHADAERAREIAGRLRDAGVDVRFDEDLRPGDRWAQQLHTLIGECFAFVVLMTPESTESEFVAKEIHLAQETKRRVLPILVRETHNLLLIDLQHINGRANRDPLPELLASLSRLGYPQPQRADSADAGH